MTTTQSRFFDELAKLMTNAAGAAQGVRREIDTLIQAQMERVLGNMELVTRDEFEAVLAPVVGADFLAARPRSVRIGAWLPVVHGHTKRNMLRTVRIEAKCSRETFRNEPQSWPRTE